MVERQPGTIRFEPGIVDKILPFSEKTKRERLPEGYTGAATKIKLLSGNMEEVEYGYREDVIPAQNDFDKKADSVLTAFRWVLSIEAFKAGTTDDDDRAEAIAQIVGASIANGLTEDEVFHIYKLAYSQEEAAARRS